MALDIPGRVREMIKQHHSVQRRKTLAPKTLGDLWKQSPKLQEILSDSSESERRMRLTAIANNTSRDSGLANRRLNRAYINCHTKLNRKSKENKWYTSGDFQQA